MNVQRAYMNYVFLIQAIAYNIFRDHHLPFFFKYLALLGALLLVLAESRQLELKSLFAGVPTLVDNKSNSYLQLTGRILLVFMFIPLLRFELSFTQVNNYVFINSFLNNHANSYLMFKDSSKYFWLFLDAAGCSWLQNKVVHFDFGAVAYYIELILFKILVECWIQGGESFFWIHLLSCKNLFTWVNICLNLIINSF